MGGFKMKKRIAILTFVLTYLISILSFPAFAVNYVPPTSYGVPQNVGVIFNGDDLDPGESGRWSFDIGLGASGEIRALTEAYEDGRFEAAGYNSLNVSVQGDYKLDNGKWRSELPGYDDWVSSSYCEFDASTGNWVSNWNIYDNYFNDVFPEEILPGGKSYFDNHTMHFRVRFTVDFYNEDESKDYNYNSAWSQEVSYTNSQKVEDPQALINHPVTLLSAELKKYDDGKPYLDFMAGIANDQIQLLNSISNQRICTNVWIKVDGGTWVDTGEWMFMKEKFTVDAIDYFNAENFDAAVYEVKFRYSFDYKYYPAAGKSGYIYSPFSNVISHGMPAYEGGSSWATTELDKASEYGLITERIKANMSQKTTREEFAEIAVKLYEKYTGKIATTGSITFTDTTNPEILKAANMGLVSGVGNNKYAPNDLVTREQMASILLRALKVINPNADFSIVGVTTFIDDDKVEKWAREGVYYCYKEKIVTGVGKVDGKDKFDADGNATREMAVIVCKRAYELYKK
jgi:hypothetical protein